MVIRYRKSNLFVISIFILVFGDAIGLYVMGGAFRVIMAGICFLTLFYTIPFLHKNLTDRLNIMPITLAVISIFLCLISLPFWFSRYNIYSYIGVVIACLVYIQKSDIIPKLIWWIVIITLVLTFYEYVTNKYIFVSTVGDKTLDEKMMGGASGVFRAKGIFHGPLSVGVFAIFSYFLFPYNKKILLMGIIMSFLSNSRTGLVILALPLIYIITNKENRKYLLYYISGFILLLGILLAISPGSLLTSFNRIGELQEGESGQGARIFFWLQGVYTFLNYSDIYLLLGNNGYFHSIYDDNPESGWICLLTDNGIIGFLFYFIPLFYVLCKFSLKKQWFYVLITSLFFFLNFILTANLSATNNLLYWILSFELLNRAKYNRGKINFNLGKLPKNKLLSHT